MNVAIWGTGTMGVGIAQVFAQGNHTVTIYSFSKESVDRAYSKLVSTLKKLIERDVITETEKQNILKNIKTTYNIEDVKCVDLVIEANREDINIKKSIFAELDKVCNKDTMFATNTSSFSITEIASVTNRPDRVIGMHFFNPAPVMQLVEVIKGIATSQETINKSLSIIEKINKQSVLVEESPGFVVNRILIPMINEAVGIFYEGIATAEDIDKSMMLGANFPMGPLALADLIGIDICLNIMNVLHSEFGIDKYSAHPFIKKMVRANKLGRKTKVGFYKY